MSLARAHRPQDVGTMALAFGCRNSRFDSPRPSLMANQSTAKHFLPYACHSAQFSERQSLAAILEKDISNAIIGLLTASCPSAVVWFVIAGVLDAFKRFSFWALAHVHKEIAKITPARTDRNSSPLVMFICRVRWLRAARRTSVPRDQTRPPRVPDYAESERQNARG